MIKTAFIFIYFTLVNATIFGAQSTNNLIWGESLQGVRLSISVSNNIIEPGSKLVLCARIENFSTNTIYLAESSPEMEFNVQLINKLGRVYQLTPPAIVFSRLIRTKLNAQQTEEWIIQVGIDKYFEPPGLVAINKKIESGDYTLKVERNFSISNNSFELVSNSLNIQVK